MTTPRAIDPGLWMLPVPLHVRTEPVNCWILRDADGALTIFDTGIRLGAHELWPEALAAIGHDVGDVRQIVVSHLHPDHIGGSAVLHELTGAPLLASARTIELAPRAWGSGGRMETYFAELRDLLALHGFPVDLAFALEYEADLARAAVEVAPPHAWQVVGDGDSIEVAGRPWQVIATPGHADGHLVLLDPGTGDLLAGDHLLERISPAVGLFPHHDSDPLGSYLASLDRIAELEIARVLPGHGAPFAGARARALELTAHHVQRIDQCVQAVREAGEISAFDVAQAVFPRVFERAEPDPANQRFATTESLAHLERACVLGRLEQRQLDDGSVRYVATGA